MVRRPAAHPTLPAAPPNARAHSGPSRPRGSRRARTVQDGLPLLEEGDGVAVGHARLHRHRQRVGLALKPHVGAVLADLAGGEGWAQQVWIGRRSQGEQGGARHGTGGAGPAWAQPRTCSRRVPGPANRRPGPAHHPSPHYVVCCWCVRMLPRCKQAHTCTAPLHPPTCVVYCWYMPGPIWCVTTFCRQLHLRVPGAGRATFLSRTTCEGWVAERRLQWPLSARPLLAQGGPRHVLVAHRLRGP